MHGTDIDRKGGSDSMKIRIQEGNYGSLGAYIKDQTLFLTLEGEREDDCAILFYEQGTEEVVRVELPKEYCLGSLYSVRLEGLPWNNYNYNFEINKKVVTDPYAKKIVGREHWNDAARERAEYRICGAFQEETFDWGCDRHPEIAKADMILYKLHVRGFTMDGGAKAKERGTFAGIEARIPYLKELGITTVEAMPVYEFEEMELEREPEIPAYLTWKESLEDKVKPVTKRKRERINYWGYTKESQYFAVKASYGKENAAFELKHLIHALHENQMEFVMEIYFEETANHNLILDALRYWLREYHVDGFHLLGTNFPMTAIAQDALLSRTKMFYTGFDYALIEKKTACDRLYVYNDEYLYPVRKMLNHYGGDMNEFAGQQRKQHEVQGFVNYLTSNNGFTLCDLFSYERKHNEANGEDNLDGNDWNYSSNCGAEGKSAKKYVKELRERQMRNAFAVLFLGQAVPLLWSGDECGNSQGGNNNAYCQDNVTGWVNWKTGARYQWLTEYVRGLISFRKTHPVIALPQPMRLNDYRSQGAPDLSYHGSSAWISGFSPNQQTVGMMYCGRYSGKKTLAEDVYLAYNFHAGESELALPKLSGRKKWHLLMNTAKGREPFEQVPQRLKNQQKVVLDGQSVAIYIGK